MLIFVQYLFLEALIIEAKSAFDKIDQDKNGEISVQELGTALRLLGLSPTREEVQTMIIGIDKKGAFGNEIKRVNSKGKGTMLERLLQILFVNRLRSYTAVSI